MNVMTTRIRVAIAGFGNLGRAAVPLLEASPDLELVAIVSRRDAASLGLDRDVAERVQIVSLDDVDSLAGQVDVMMLCGGSKDDLPVQGPLLASKFNTVDSYDTHAKIPEYFDSLDRAAQDAGTTAVLSTGWDPGLFSIQRLYGEAILPNGATYTFWGKGLSQGHSDAVRRVPGVAGGVQYTIPSERAMERARSSERPELETKEKHVRHCFVVLEEGADAAQVEQAIVTMPDYFADYDTTVEFISEQQLKDDHHAMPHGGFVIRNATTPDGHQHTMEFALKLDHNPAFTASVLVAYARASYRLNQSGQIGAMTPFDIAPGLLSPRSPEDLRRDLL